MIPILYEASETAFSTNGIGRLTDCIECKVTEVRNGKYECEFKYPVFGKWNSELQKNAIVYCTHDDTRIPQPFRIYRISTPLNGIVTYNARHISYDLNNVILQPFTAVSAADAMSQLRIKSINTNGFTFWTDKATAADFAVEAPMAVRNALGGTRGSILDVYGGEYEFDKFTVKLHAVRGDDNGVELRYGKNVLDMDQVYDVGATYDAVVPYWYQDGTLVTAQGYIVKADANASKPVALDLTGEFEDPPTQQQLHDRALSFLGQNTPWKAANNVKIDFVALWQTGEYKDYAILQRVKLCDFVTLYIPNIRGAWYIKVVKTVYNVLTDRYDEIELGEPRSSFGDTLTKSINETVAEATRNMVNKSMLQAAVDHATELIAGGLGGHIVINRNAAGEPEELLIMDTDDINTAVNVWRWNLGGLGHSHSGYNGPFDDVALTMDGQINANMITTGTLLATLIYGGVLTLGGQDNGNGVLRLLNGSGFEVGSMDNTGLELISDTTYYDQGSSAYYRRSAKFESGKLDMYVTKQSDNTKYAMGYIRPDVDGVTVGSAPPQNFYGTVEAKLEAARIISNNTMTGSVAVTVDSNGGRTFNASDVDDVYLGYNTPIKFGGSFGIGTSGSELRLGINLSGSETSSPLFRGLEFNQNGSTLHLYNTDLAVGSGGTKSKLFSDEKQERTMYCYETPTPYFGDLGCGRTDESGICYVYPDEAFKNAVNTGIQYQVFLQAESPGTLWVDEKAAEYFVVKGDPGIAFSWEIKAKQAGFETLRMEVFNMEPDIIEPDYIEQGNNLFEKYIMEVSA